MNPKVKNILIIIMSVIAFTIMGIFGISTAANIGENPQVYVGVETGASNPGIQLGAYDDNGNYLAPNDTFCVWQNRIINSNTLYSVINHVKIDGTHSNPYGQDLNLNENGIFGWILAQPDGNAGEDDVLTNHYISNNHGLSYSKKQQAVYGYFNTWQTANNLGFENYSGGESYPAWETEAQNYVNSNYNVTASITNNKKDVQVDVYTHNNIDYAKVGPFNWTYTGNLENVNVYDQNNKAISGVKYAKYNGTNLEVFDSPSGAISSGNNFYILVSVDGSVEKITKIEAGVKVQAQKIVAEVWTLAHGEQQRLITTTAHTEPNDSNTTLTINDEIPLLIKLSGYVWKDQLSGKTSQRNNWYAENSSDDKDEAMDGIKVRLKDTSGNIIKETTTKENGLYDIDGGEYIFDKVLICKLKDYYIEFEYDGLTYTNVVKHLDKNNGSKSEENANVRAEFNNNFGAIENKSGNTGLTRYKDASGVEKLSLEYNQAENASTLVNKGQYTITANTQDAGYSIYDVYKKIGGTEIKYINLGLYEREQPEIHLQKDVQNAVVAINGNYHVYNYENRFNNIEEYESGYKSNDPEKPFNVGVKFKGRGTSYTRAIYKSDIDYKDENDKSRELKVYVTYKIRVINQSSTLKSKINSIVDYYNANYTLVGAGTSIDETTGNVAGALTTSGEASYNSQYKKTVITSSETIDPGKTGDIYVQFALNKDAVLSVLNTQTQELNNVAEINSYSILDSNGVTYAGIDKFSAPGNAVPENIDSYERDTDVAPLFKLEAKGERALTGTVFEDTATSSGVGQIRQGDGELKDGEKGIPGVQVTLTETSGAAVTGETSKTVTTDENGNFTIDNYIAGTYKITYTWGDKTYTVRNYKGTIYKTEEHQGEEWYKTTTPRYTDAVDDYARRQEIDEKLKDVTQSSKQNFNDETEKMNSTTQDMKFGVEYDKIVTDYTTDYFGYIAQNIDFGIIERARQDLALTKTVNSLKLTLANGQEMINANIEDIKAGKVSGVIYLPPSEANKNGQIKIELDNEMVQGSQIEAGYKITATNNSELDYLSKDYYKYGTITGKVVTMTAKGIVDYLDTDWGYDKAKNTAWTELTLEELKPKVVEAVYGEESNIANTRILFTEALADKQMAPTASESVDLNVSKVLTTTDDIELDNETELTEVTKTGGSDTESTPGNYVPGTGEQRSDGKVESDDQTTTTVLVTPPTGEDNNYIIYTVAGLAALAGLGIGILIIKKVAIK